MSTAGPTEKHCPEGPRGDNATHHLTPKGEVMVCMYCGQTEKQLRDHDGIVKRTQGELIAVLTERFGDNAKAWAFMCPSCGDIATSGEFKDLMEEAGIDGYGSDRLGQECIGRLSGALKKGSPYEGRGCDWAAFGLFSGPEFVIAGEKEIASFPVAPAPEKH